MLPVNQAAVSLFGASLVPMSSATSPSMPGTGSGLAAANALLSASGLIPAVPAGATAAPAPFADLLTEAVGEVQHLEVQAKSAIEGLISGKGVDVHEAMIAAQKAGMGFELMLSVRNKALAAYQQVLGMQF
jgi:flagellar hook-basal body complex protein FliE